MESSSGRRDVLRQGVDGDRNPFGTCRRDLASPGRSRFDAAYRYAMVNGHAVNEIRAGLTFAFKVESDKTPVKPGVTFGNWGLSR